MTPRATRHTRLLLLLALPAILGAGPRQHRLFLSAGAPWGAPGAHRAFPIACDDTVHRDTLYLSFEPARDDTGFLAVQGEIVVHAQPGDSLGSYWSMARGGANNGGLVAQFGPDETFPQPQPWPTAGVGSVMYDRTALSGRLRFVFAIPVDHPARVKAGTRYVLGRLLLGAKHPGLDGCERPVCIEWRDGQLGFAGSGAMEAARGGGALWLARGTREDACRGRVPAWTPKTMGGGEPPPPPDDPR